MALSHKVTSRLDGLAVFFSGTCLLHCLALPLMVTLFPVFQGTLVDEQMFHLVMLFLILPTSMLALGVGCLKHKDLLTISLGAVGLTILGLTAIFGHDWFGYMGERIVTSLGGLVLAASHIRNFLLCRRDDCDHHHDDHGDYENSGTSHS